jgi:RNA polymerase primary sigma factor
MQKRARKEPKNISSSGISTRESQSLERYLQEIAKKNLITPDEEVQLAQRIRQGDQVALDRLVQANLRFVVSVAKMFQNQGLPLPDLISEGNLGLIKAARRFDETRGFKFISYAVWWVRQSILQAIAEKGRMIRIPLNRTGQLTKISRASAALEQQLEREPTDEELATLLGISLADVITTRKASVRHVSFDAPIMQGEDSTLADKIENVETPNPDFNLMEDSRRTDVERALADIPRREAEIVKLYYGIGVDHALTLEEIAERFDLTRERVRQIKEKALRKLRVQKCAVTLRNHL